MSLTVKGAFEKFNREYVNLDPDRTDVANSSRAWLFSQLDSLAGKISDFPIPYAEKHINFGSFARKTKIRPLDDIDLIFAIHAQSSAYEQTFLGDDYVIKPSSTSDRLLGLCNDDGTLNSIKVVNKFVSSLNKIDQYKGAEKHRKEEAVTLNLNSYEWNFDIVPAFFTVNSFYLIPNGKGGWKGTNPRIDQQLSERVNLKHHGKILQLIRTLKFWNKRKMMITIPSYLFEMIILRYFDNLDTLSEHIDVNLIYFWDYLIDGIHYDIDDPKGHQGNLNTLSIEQRNNITEATRTTAKTAREAFGLEVETHDTPASIRKWAEIFGSNFT